MQANVAIIIVLFESFMTKNCMSVCTVCYAERYISATRRAIHAENMQ